MNTQTADRRAISDTNDQEMEGAGINLAELLNLSLARRVASARRDREYSSDGECVMA